MANKSQSTKTQANDAASKKTSFGSARANALPGQNKSNNGSSYSTKQSSTDLQKTLKQMFENLLKDVYSAEQQLVSALPEIAKAAENEELQDAFNDHLNQTRRHVERLDKIFNRIGVSGKGETCKAMEGLIEETKKVISEYEENAVRDSALIIGAQKIEHYEIASYGSLCELADVLGYHKIHDVLGRTLDEEEEADNLLTDLATDINDEAVELNGGEEVEDKEIV